jgi:hypothetical protein
VSQRLTCWSCRNAAVLTTRRRDALDHPPGCHGDRRYPCSSHTAVISQSLNTDSLLRFATVRRAPSITINVMQRPAPAPTFMLCLSESHRWASWLREQLRSGSWLAAKNSRTSRLCRKRPIRAPSAAQAPIPALPHSRPTPLLSSRCHCIHRSILSPALSEANINLISLTNIPILTHTHLQCLWSHYPVTLKGKPDTTLTLFLDGRNLCCYFYYYCTGLFLFPKALHAFHV